MSKVRNIVPRGFTRFYVLYLLSENPMTGKEIIEEATMRSEGEWKPSPGLIYPLLGRLLKDSSIEENEDGRFVMTEKGVSDLQEHRKLQEQLERQLNLVSKLGLSMFTKGKLLAEESVDRIMAVTSTIKEHVSDGSTEIQNRFNKSYRNFLIGELEKLDEEKEARDEEDSSQPK